MVKWATSAILEFFMHSSAWVSWELSCTCIVTSWAWQWRHNGCDGVLNHQPHDCLLNRLFRRRSRKTPKLRVDGLCAGNSPVTGEFLAQMASYAENVSIWWHHHEDDVNEQHIVFSLIFQGRLAAFTEENGTPKTPYKLDETGLKIPSWIFFETSKANKWFSRHVWYHGKQDHRANTSPGKMYPWDITPRKPLGHA